MRYFSQICAHMEQNLVFSLEKIISDIQAVGQNEILPNTRLWDEKQIFPTSLFKNLAQKKILGIIAPKIYGGLGLNYKTYADAIIALAKFDGAIAMSVAAHNSLVVEHLVQFATENQKKRWIKGLIQGEYIGAWALTEPNVGSDASNLETTAEKKNEYWIINGKKKFITHGKNSHVVIVLAKTSKTLKNNITAFIIDKKNPGISVEKSENKMGMRASETSTLIFNTCKVHESNIIGHIGEGFSQAMQILEGGRISIAALSIGIAKGAFDIALQYAQKREQFGKKLINFQGIAFKLADMATQIEAGYLLTLKAAQAKDKKQSVNQSASMAKYYCSETAVAVTNQAIQILGGNGYCKEYLVEKFYRDAKLCTIGEGTSEIQKIIIAKNLTQNHAKKY